MSEKYYVVTEEELKTLRREAEVRGELSAEPWGPLIGSDKGLIEIEAACRSRPVESIGGGMWQDEGYTGEHK